MGDEGVVSNNRTTLRDGQGWVLSGDRAHAREQFLHIFPQGFAENTGFLWFAVAADTTARSHFPLMVAFQLKNKFSHLNDMEIVDQPGEDVGGSNG